MNSFHDNAVKVVRDYLVHLLMENNWCAARTVGHALGRIIDSFPKEVLIHRGNFEESAKMEVPRTIRELDREASATGPQY
jgi:hypothetical protein